MSPESSSRTTENHQHIDHLYPEEGELMCENSEPKNASPVKEQTRMEKTSRSYTHSVVFAVLFYLVTSITMVIFNKMILNEFGLPLTFLWIQLALAAVILKAIEISGLCSKFCPLSRGAFLKIIPLIIINVVGLALNTLCLRHLDASLYQVARALILPFTVFLTCVVLHQRSSFYILMSCAVVSGGFLVGIFAENEVEISLLGIIFGIGSSVTTALHSIIIKKSLGIVEHSLDLVYYNNLFSAILFFPAIFLESLQVFDLFHTSSGERIVTFLLGAFIAVPNICIKITAKHTYTYGPNTSCLHSSVYS